MKTKTIILVLLTVVSTNLFAQINKSNYSLDFNTQKHEMQTVEYNGQQFDIRAFEKIVYVANPIDTIYQIMNIYIPEAYFNGKTINGYSTETAPIFFPNQIGGYMPAKPASIQNNTKRENAVIVALSKGYVVVSAGARGRTNKDGNNIFYGKAPAGIIDLKSAVRYLKYNDKIMPGDANKIISNGTSAGGAMSTLLGATGDNADYLPYLKEVGAANSSDAIFAVSAYCPITNLDHADMAYEWQFYGVNNYIKRGSPSAQNNSDVSDLEDTQIKTSADLKDQFPAYVNSLQLKDSNGNVLTLDADGNGNFKDLVKYYVIESANKALNSGADLSQHSWIIIQNEKVTDLDWDAYIRYMERMKTPPAFDALDLSSGENNVFGTATVNNQHFTVYGQRNSYVDATEADELIVKMMNPMYYIGTPDSQTAMYWRIRHGSKDKDTGLAISAILATYLQNNGYSVDYALPWDKPHSGDYDLDELFQWADNISK